MPESRSATTCRRPSRGPRKWLPSAAAAAVLLLTFGACRKRESPPAPEQESPAPAETVDAPADSASPVEPPPPPTAAFRLGDLAPPPDWRQLDAFQRTITRESFVRLLGDVFSEGDAWARTIKVADTHADIVTSTADGANLPPFRLHFAADEAAEAAAVPARYWQEPHQLPPPDDLDQRPLAGVHIAIDPGHIGGKWARLEERWYSIGDGAPVMEGSMTLRVAKLLKPKLEALGAKVTLVRENEEPVSPKRPEDFTEEARAIVAAMGIDPDSPDPPPMPRLSVEWNAEKLFYRTSEIRARADLVNDRIRPDLVVCLHFNAEAWGDPAKPDFVPANHLHLIVNGCYGASEFALDDQRFALLNRLLQRTHRTELALSETVADAMAAATGLPPYTYPGTNAKRVSDHPFVWARNLLANRVYDCPVVFLEPYVMNCREVYDRIQAGDYEGEREVAGAVRPSIYREYASSVADGLAAHFRATRQAPPPR